MFGILKPNVKLELEEGEQIIYYIRRHWVLLFSKIALPLLFAVVTLGLASYRAIGGVFFAMDAGVAGRLDVSNIIFLLLMAAVLLWWARRNDKNKKKKSSSGLFLDAVVVFGVVVLGLVVYFRYQGGRVFSIDPTYTRGGDIFNLALLVLGIAALGACFYIVADWANDFLILTNTRVIYDDTQLLVRHVSQEILIDNIQQVSLSAQSYVAHFLGHLTLWRDQFLHFVGLRHEPPPEKANVAYGKLVIGSLSFRKLIFDWARDPVTMQSKINGELSKLRKQQEPALLRRIIEDQVYDGKTAPPQQPPIQVEERRGPIPWLFETNPEIDYKKGEITWRPYWLFMLIDMLPALVALLLATIALAIGLSFRVIGAGPLVGLWLLIALGCVGRIIWVREEHANDKYILQTDKIIDVDKKPFGPESSRSAPLGNIQDVSFDVSFVESVLGYGDVTIETGGGGGKFTFKHVPDPRNVQATINDYLTDFKKREKERQQQATLALIKQYHVAQRDHQELLDDQQRQALVERASASLDVASRVEQEVATQVPDVVRRQVDGAVRRELWRTGLFRRRRS